MPRPFRLLACPQDLQDLPPAVSPILHGALFRLKLFRSRPSPKNVLPAVFGDTAGYTIWPQAVPFPVLPPECASCSIPNTAGETIWALGRSVSALSPECAPCSIGDTAGDIILVTHTLSQNVIPAVLLGLLQGGRFWPRPSGHAPCNIPYAARNVIF